MRGRTALGISDEVDFAIQVEGGSESFERCSAISSAVKIASSAGSG